MHGDANRRHRRRLEHDAPARRERRSRTVVVPLEKEKRAALARRGDRALRRRLGDVHRGRREGGARDGEHGATQRRRVARRLPHGSRPAARERRRARRCAYARGGRPARVLSTEEEGTLAYGGAVATADIELPRARSPCATSAAPRPRSPSARPDRRPDWVASVDLGSVRLTARADGHRRGAPEAAEAFAHLGPPKVEARARRRRQRARDAPARRRVSSARTELAEALRIVETTLAARDRPALRRRSRARPRSSRPGCDPARRGAAEARRAAARLRRRHPRGRRPRVAALARRRRNLKAPGSPRTSRRRRRARRPRPSSGCGRARARRRRRACTPTTPSARGAARAAAPCALARAARRARPSPSRRRAARPSARSGHTGSRRRAAHRRRSSSTSSAACLRPRSSSGRSRSSPLPVVAVAGRRVAEQEHAHHSAPSSVRSRDVAEQPRGVGRRRPSAPRRPRRAA